jgi:hypothetical protein
MSFVSNNPPPSHSPIDQREIELKASKQETEKSEQIVLIGEWLNQHQNDYIAHAIWEGNVEKVIHRGAVLPAEAVLKESNVVEFEKGETYGTRGTLKLVELMDSDKKTFTELSSQDANKLRELEEKEKKDFLLRNVKN